MPRLTKIGALKIASPEKWRLEVRRALRQAKGDLTVAAAALEVSRRVLSRWIECAARKGDGKTSSQADRCGVCDGCQLVGKLPLGQPGRPWPAAEEEE